MWLAAFSLGATSEWLAESNSTPTCTEKLTVANMNEQVVQVAAAASPASPASLAQRDRPRRSQAEYAVRGRILDRAVQLKQQQLVRWQ